MSSADRLIKENGKPQKEIDFSISDVKKSIEIYAKLIEKEIQSYDNSDDDSSEQGSDWQNSDEDLQQYGNTSQTEDVTGDNEKQRKINLFVALSQAEIKPYKNEPFIAQIYTSTNEQKQAIDSIRKDLTQFILGRMHYEYLKLEVFTQEVTENKPLLYNPMDKFAFLAKSSPALETLKQVFKADIKY